MLLYRVGKFLHFPHLPGRWYMDGDSTIGDGVDANGLFDHRDILRIMIAIQEFDKFQLTCFDFDI